MAKTWKRVTLAATAIVMASSMAVTVVACKPTDEPEEPTGYKQGTFRTFTSTMPSNWNGLTYQDNNDTQILDYIVGSLFTYDYEFDGNKYNEDGTINTAAIVPGGFVTQYEAVTALEDVTSSVDASWGYTDAQKAEGGYAWKLTLRQDLKWDDGTAIKASDFVYSMQEQLNPDFLNFRASQYYNDVRIKGAYNYLYSKTEYVYSAIASVGYENAAAALADGQTVYFDVWSFWGAEGYVDADGNESPQYVSITDTTVYDDPSAWEAGEEIDAFSGKDIFDTYYGTDYLSDDDLVVQVENDSFGATFEQVGIYSTGDYEFVLCLESPFQFLKEDGSLSYLSAYYLQTLPLVKKDLYESCKVEPASGATLWTSTYNSSLETTASWGPYKLGTFQSGKSYTLERNEYWYGWNMEEYKNQYNVTKIECERISETNTAWMSFFSGSLDDKGLDNAHLDDYKSSKYVYYSATTATFGMQIYSGIDKIKVNDRNNGILAIPEFRQAMSLALDRSEFATDVLAPNQAAYGVINSQYYYDVEQGGVYRNTEQAKEGLLRVYGYTQADDGTWSNSTGTISGYSTDDAYATIGGSNMAKARELVRVAYEKLTANAADYGYDSTKPITILIGWSSPHDTYTKAFNYFKSSWEEMVTGTPLEGQLNLTYNEELSNTWADKFKEGAYDIAPLAGISGNPLNPYMLIQCYIDSSYTLNYHQYWDTNSIPVTITFGADDNAEYSGKTFTMSALNWYFCLNGLAETYQDSRNLEYAYVMSEGYLSESNRLLILAALEELVLEQYQFVPIVSNYSATLLGAKFSYISDEYNLFTGFGGYRYMVVNYTDAEWDAFVKAQGGDLKDFYKVSD